MQKELSLCLDKETSLEKEERATTSSEGSSSTLKRSLQPLSEESPPNTKGTKRHSPKKSRRGCPDTPSGIMLSSCSQELPHCYWDGSSLSPKVKLQRRRNLSPNT